MCIAEGAPDMIFLREYFAARFNKTSVQQAAQEPPRETKPEYTELPLSEECMLALQTRAPQRVLEILNGIDPMSARLTSMARLDQEVASARGQGAWMKIGPA